MKNLYYVAMKGVYWQGVYFISDSKDEAIKAADLYAKNDVDSYHDWYVIKYEKMPFINPSSLSYDFEYEYKVNKGEL
jgi:hypothetical protein